jgi:hypothetical protein
VVAAVVDRTDETATDVAGDGAPLQEVGPGPHRPTQLDAPFARERHARPATLTRAPTALERAVDAAGQAWALDWSNALSGEGRPVSGGWPGTLSEARGRVAACVARRVGPARRLGPEELESLARRAYAAARKTWLARADLADDD